MNKVILMVTAAMMTAVFIGCKKGEVTPEQPVEQGEVALFDKQREVIAYIDYNNDATIYLWEEGDAVAYLDESEDQVKNVYGFNGKFLGWYKNGVLYDKEGWAVGAKKGVKRVEIEMNTVIWSAKGTIHDIPAKQAKEIPPARQVGQDQWWSKTTLKDLLKTGRDKE
jgi:hypothetical protein